MESASIFLQCLPVVSIYRFQGHEGVFPLFQWQLFRCLRSVGFLSSPVSSVSSLQFSFLAPSLDPHLPSSSVVSSFWFLFFGEPSGLLMPRTDHNPLDVVLPGWTVGLWLPSFWMLELTSHHWLRWSCRKLRRQIFFTGAVVQLWLPCLVLMQLIFVNSSIEFDICSC